MSRNLGCRIRVSVAVLVLGTTAGVVGMAALPATAGAAPSNLIQNGSFETTTTPVTTGGYLTVDAGDSATIPGWTVVTPSYDVSGGGSVDVVSSTYNNWVCEDQNNCIDLAGTTNAPGGLYQDVATTPGVEYSLSFWTAANGDQTQGVSHTVGVTVNGSPVDTATAVSAGAPLQWTLNTVTFTATSTSSQIEFDDTTNAATGPYDGNQGPTLDNVSLTAVTDIISASAVIPPIPPQVTNTPFNGTVATFTDTDTAYLPSQFTTTITWGDGQTSTGIVSGSGGSYTVAGMHTYGAIGTYGPVVVNISDPSGATGIATDNSVQVANAVTSCSGNCSTTVPPTTQNPETAQVSTSGSGYVLLSLAPNSGATAVSCGDGYRHAPSVTVETNTFPTQTGTVTATNTFPAKDGTKGTGVEGLIFWVCFQSKAPFKDLTGQSVTTGLLPVCNPIKPGSGPCINYILPTSGGNITEKITYPAADPGYR